METFPDDVKELKNISDDVISGIACCQRRAAVAFVAILLLVTAACAVTPKTTYVCATLCRWLGWVTHLLLLTLHAAFCLTARLMARHWPLLAALAATWTVFPAAVDDLLFLTSVTADQYWTLATGGLQAGWAWLNAGEGAWLQL